MIVAIMAVVVFIGAANAGDCSRSKSAEAISVEAHHNTDDKADVEPELIKSFSALTPLHWKEPRFYCAQASVV